MRIGRRRREADLQHYAEIDPVVAHIAAFFRCQTGLLEQVGERLGFVLHALIDVGDIHFLRPRRDDARLAPGDDRRFDAGLAQQLHAVPVHRVERLHRVAFRRKQQAAVGQHTVDVENHQLDAACAFSGGKGGDSHQITFFENRSCMLSAPISLPASSTTSI
jgi:hypothetical protein